LAEQVPGFSQVDFRLEALFDLGDGVGHAGGGKDRRESDGQGEVGGAGGEKDCGW